jgi:hypothetical protein
MMGMGMFCNKGDSMVSRILAKRLNIITKKNSTEEEVV